MSETQAAYRSTPPPTDTIADEGTLLAHFDRSENERLEIRWRSYQGRPFLDFRIRFQPEGKTYWTPTKKGCTVRSKELHQLRTAIEAAIKLNDQHTLNG